MAGLSQKLRDGLACLGVSLVALGLGALPALDGLHGLDNDFGHLLSDRLFPVPVTDPADYPVVVVAIDEATHTAPAFKGLPKVMWTPMLAQVQDAVLGGGAKAFGWDLVLPTTAARYVADKRFDKPLMLSLAKARRGGRVVLGTIQLGEAAIEPYRGFLLAAGGARNLRSLNLIVDPGGIVRAVPSFLETQRSDGATDWRPSLALELAARATGLPPTRGEDGGVRLGDRPIDGARGDRLTVSFRGTSAIPTYSLADLHDCAARGEAAFFEQFAGKVVLLGLVLDVEDRHLSSERFVSTGGPPGPTPRCDPKPATADRAVTTGLSTAGVYIHAAAVQNLLAGQVLATAREPVRSLFSLPLALGAAGLAFLVPALLAMVLSAGLVLAWWALAGWVFTTGAVLPVIDPTLAAMIAVGAVIVYRFTITDREKRFLKAAFGSYVAPAVVERLIEDPSRLHLGGERREMTFLFTDIAGFTTLVEKLDPDQVGSMLNDYLDGMIGIAKRHEGTIDKIIGDAVVVIFSAPVGHRAHAQLAVECALEMDVFSQGFAERKRAEGVPFKHTRVGVHSGEAVVGNFGGSGFFDYTALGDAMNTAARLESVNKHLGTRICVSGDVVDRVPDFVGRPVGELVLKGKTEPVRAYEPLTSSAASSDAVAEYMSAYERMADGDPAAEAAFKELAERTGDPLAGYHATRLAAGEAGTRITLAEK